MIFIRHRNQDVDLVEFFEFDSPIEKSLALGVADKYRRDGFEVMLYKGEKWTPEWLSAKDYSILGGETQLTQEQANALDKAIESPSVDISCRDLPSRR